MSAKSITVTDVALETARRIVAAEDSRDSFPDERPQWSKDLELIARAILRMDAKHDRLTEEVARLRDALATAVNRMQDAGPDYDYDDVIAQGREALGRE